MESYNEKFGFLITHCRDNALEELRSNKRYIKLKGEENDLRIRLEAIISPEAAALLEEYAVAGVSVKAMECNRTFLSGMTVRLEILKRFDASTDEYKEFEDEYL